MEKKFVKISHDDISELHRGMLGAESLIVEEREIEFVQDLMNERDYLTAGLTLCDLGQFQIAREIIEKLKMKMLPYVPPYESKEFRKISKIDQEKIVDLECEKIRRIMIEECENLS